MTILDRLNRDWAQLADAPSPLPGLSHAEALAAIGREPDATLGRLLSDGSSAARRIVLQAMLGRVAGMAARDPGATVDDYVAHLALCVATYPLARRPRRIGANLALDTLKGVLAERAPRLETVTAAPEPLPPEPPEPEPGAAAVIARAGALGLITDDTRRVLHLVYADGLPGRAAARAHGLSEPALRQRCSKAVRRLAAHRLALVA